MIQSSPDLSIYRAGPSQVPLQYARRYPKRAGSETGRNALAGIGRPSRIDRSWFSSPKSGRFRPSWSSRRSACRHCLATLPITSNGTLEAGFRFALAADPTTCHRAPCRLDKHERITKLAICDSSARPPGAHRQARCAHAAHNFALSFACIAGTYGWPESMTMVRLQKSRAAANAASRGTP